MLDRIRLQSQEVDPPQLVEKLAWLCEIVAKINSYLGDDSLVDELHRALLRRETIAEISKKYYDGQSILFPETENRLNQVIQQLQSMLLADKEPQQQSSLSIELAAWEADLKAQVPAMVEALVVRTEVETLQRFGQWEAAWEVLHRHAVARAEHFCSSLLDGPKG